jgi:hypothetical protein
MSREGCLAFPLLGTAAWPSVRAEGEAQLNMSSTLKMSPNAGARSVGSAGWIQATLTLFSLHAVQARGENTAGYRYENYKEGGDRINIETQSGLFEIAPKSWLTLKTDVVYDAISGATPTGAPPPASITNWVTDPSGNPPPGASSTSVPLSPMTDERWAGSIAATFSYKQHRLTPQFSYSHEHDYHARGAALNYSLDLNQKNTTLNLGVSHNWDDVLPNGFLHTTESKNADDVILGVNQLLGPKTVLTANLAFGNARGYLNDQYKGVLFESTPQGDPAAPALEPEQRPDDRNKYIAYLSLTQDITPLDASVEGSYRFFHDTFDINAHTVQLGWNQKIGKFLLVSPFFRYYYQGEANFYVTQLPDYDTRPEFYSADYRLSQLQTFTLGVSASVKLKEWLWLDVGYKRYIMEGLDGETSSTAYPKAHIVSVGGRVWF